jgi:hypothetical protein
MKSSFPFRLIVFGLLCSQLPAQIEVVSDGKVGVGTSSPAARLDVVDTSGHASLRVFSNNPSNGRTSTLELAAGNGSDSGSASIIKFSTLTTQQHAKLQIQNSAGSNLMNVNDAGNVGIGLTDPGSRRLKVVTSASSNDVGVELAIGRTSGTNYGLLATANGSGADSNQGILTTAANGTSNYGLRIYNVAAGASNYALYSDSAAQSYFQGNVGIGTAAPAQKLSIQGSHGDTLLQLFSDAYGQGVNGANTALLTLWASEPGWTWTGVGLGNNFYNASRVTTTRGASFIRLLDNAIHLTTYDSSGTDKHGIWINDGKVSVGNPGTFNHTLNVGGSVRATSFISDTQTYADFVFKPDYRLPALSEVETHIKKHGHLPGIPSEAEARANGIDLARMQVQLLQKVEELTLHVIAQEKRIHSLENENNRLKTHR